MDGYINRYHQKHGKVALTDCDVMFVCVFEFNISSVISGGTFNRQASGTS